MSHLTYILISISLVNTVQSQGTNDTVNTTNDFETFEFDLASGANCAASIKKEQLPNYAYANYSAPHQKYRFEFNNGSCDNPTLWYSYYAIYYDLNSSTSHLSNHIYSDDYSISIPCYTNSLCSQLDVCVSNYNISTPNQSNNTGTVFEFQTAQSNYTSTKRCPSPHSNFTTFVTILCGDYNFTSTMSRQEFLDQSSSGALPQCGNDQLTPLPSSSTTTTTSNDETESVPICTIYPDDNWFSWVYLGVAFVFVSITLFFCMTRVAGIKISIKKWGGFLMLFMTSWAIASIVMSLMTTFVTMATYDKCNTLQSQAEFTPWDWKEDWEKDSLMGFWFWLFGAVISSAMYTFILLIKFQIKSVSQYEDGADKDCGEKCMGYCIKGIFFIITFSFSAVLRPYYAVGHHSMQGSKCACVGENVALISEIYGAALLSILFGPFAFICGGKCVEAVEDEDEDKNWCVLVVRLCGCLLMLYALYCAFIVVAAPFLFIAFRIMEYIESAEDFFTSDDFIMFIWFCEAVSNFFVDLFD
eukprot:768645_1